MGLVDLRGRENEPAVRSLLVHAHGSRESIERALACYRERRWILIGWEEEDELAACAGVERRDSTTIALHSVAVVPERRLRGIGRALIDGLASVGTARRIVAETDADAAAFYGRCGFRVSPIDTKGDRGRFRCVRTIETRPGSASEVFAFTLRDLERAIRAAWGREASDDPDEWSEDNPARGQCAVTALLVRDLLGGEILLANVLRKGERVERHAWNRLPSGLAIDLTRSQFKEDEQLEEPCVGEPIMADPSRYELLTSRVRSELQG